MNEHPEENVKWNDQLQDFRRSNANRELFGIDGEPIEFEWNLFRGFTSWQILQKIQEFLGARQTSPEEFEHRLIFMSMFNDIDGQRKKCLKNVFRIPKKSRITQKQSFRVDIGHSSDPEKTCGTHIYKPEGQCSGICVGVNCQTKWTSNIPRYQCAQSWNPEKKS